MELKVTTKRGVKPHFDINHVDKDVLYHKFEAAITAKNIADTNIVPELLIIKKELVIKEDDQFWVDLMEKLCYPLHTKCINNEPLISAEEVDHETILTGEVVCISSDSPDRIKTKLMINCGLFDIVDYQMISIMEYLKQNIAVIINALNLYQEDLYENILSGMGELDMNSLNALDAEIEKIKELKQKLFKPAIQIIESEEKK